MIIGISCVAVPPAADDRHDPSRADGPRANAKNSFDDEYFSSRLKA
jgi:hypothetical protein